MEYPESLGTIIVDGEIIDLDTVPIAKLEKIITQLKVSIEEKKNEIFSIDDEDDDDENY